MQPAVPPLQHTPQRRLDLEATPLQHMHLHHRQRRPYRTRNLIHRHAPTLPHPTTPQRPPGPYRTTPYHPTRSLYHHGPTLPRREPGGRRENTGEADREEKAPGRNGRHKRAPGAPHHVKTSVYPRSSGHDARSAPTPRARHAEPGARTGHGPGRRALPRTRKTPGGGCISPADIDPARGPGREKGKPCRGGAETMTANPPNTPPPDSEQQHARLNHTTTLDSSLYPHRAEKKGSSRVRQQDGHPPSGPRRTPASTPRRQRPDGTRAPSAPGPPGLRRGGTGHQPAPSARQFTPPGGAAAPEKENHRGQSHRG